MVRNDMVIGIDEFLDEKEQNNENYFMWFKKFYQRIYNRTGSEYLDWVSAAPKQPRRYDNKTEFANHLYFYGHSLNVTDEDVISKLILQDGTKSHILFYDEELDLAQKITNLVSVIGEKELIKRTGGKNASIVFEKTQKPVIVEK